MSGSRRSSNASTIEKKGTIVEPKKFKLSTKMKTFLRRGNLPLASITKTLLNQTMSAISKQECAVSFLYPVNAKRYPEYYEAIEKPMDISTVQDNLKAGRYATLQMWYKDLALIWNNCRDYNLEGSDIYNDADSLQNFVDALFEEKFSDLMDSGVKGEVAEPAGAASGSLHKRKRESRVEEKEEDVVHIEAKDLVDENTELSFAVMSKLLKEMKNHEFSEPFMEPVSVDEAPGYLNVVKRPMDFRTLGKQLKAGNFTTGKGSFIGSMRLIWRNCFAYNDPDSEIYQWAAILERKFEELLEESVASSTVALPASIPKQVSKKPPLEEEKLSDPMPVAPARKKKKGEGRATASALSQLLREISSDPRATPFLYPVDPSQAPGYLEIIKEPMDLSLISSKIGIYEDAPVELLRDLNLMLDNCQEYNTEESDIYQSVEPYRAFIHAKFSTFCEAHHLEVEMSDSVHLRKGQALYEMNVLPPVPPPPSLSTKALDPSLPLLHRVEADVAAYSLRNPVRAETTNQTLSLTVADADRLLDELLADDNGGSNSYVKLKAFQIASKLLNTTPLPFSHAMYTVKNFGYLDEALATKGNMVLDGVIVPNGYQCSTCLRLTATVSTGRRKTIQHDVDVQVVSFVTYRDQKPLFAVALVDGVTISSASHPREVWLQFLEETPNIVLHLGSKLRRCRAVLNRLCIHPLVTPFLERIDPYSAEGKEYYRDIRAPMWLSEVHKRLVEGAYNSEFEFMFDVRLVFANCMGYNTPDSTLYQSASALLADFEQLMCLWVFNVSDRSVTDIVRGPWEQWAYLRYFDAPTNMVNVCRATGVRASESSLLFCSSCEDQYLPASIGVSHTASLRKSWLCDRCKAGGGEISSLAVTKAYSIEELGQPLLARASELGTGWFKTVAANSGPTERSFVVSPSGMKCDQHIPSEYEKLKKVEATRHDSLIKVRQLEFNKELKLGHRLDRGSRLKLNASTASAPSMSLGVLATLSSDMATFTWSIAAAPSSSTSSSSLTAHAQIHVDVRSIPPFGYFGLSEEQIKGRIEGLRFSGNCPSYLFAEAGNIRNSFISELTKSRDARRIRKQCEERANDYIANERWFWELKLLKNSSMLERKRGAVVQESLSPDLYDNMANLFPEEFSSEEAETLLSTWDFLSSARPFLPELGIGFSELIRSLQQVSNPLLPSAPQVIFDEVCMALTALLLEDIRRRAASLDASVWHEVLWAKPVNIISWPTVAYQTCIALLQERYFGKSMSPTTLKDLLNASPNGDDAIRLQLFTLLVSHPFVPELVNFAKLKSSASFSVQSIQRKCLASIAGKEEAYTSMATFISDVECLWEDIYSAYSSGSIEYSAAELVRKWFVSLLTKLNISLADGMYSPHMRQHEQQHDSEVSHPSTWTDAQSIPIHALKLASSSVVNSFDDIKFSSGFGPFYGATPRLAPNCGAGEGVTANSNELSGHPACFGTHATFVGDHLLCMASLIHIETTLTTLLASNSDYWSRRERIDVLAVLVDLAASSSQYRELLASATDVKIAAGLPNKTALQARAPPNAPLTKTQRVASKDISDVPPSPRQLVEIMEDFVVPKVPESQSQMRCFFSGTDIAHSKGEPWVYVPRYLLRTPLGEKIPTDRDRPIALKNLTLRIAAAREIAENEHRTSMDRESFQIASLTAEPRPELPVYQRRIAVHRTSPLGRDRHGSEYWMLSAQDSDPLVPLHRMSSSKAEMSILVDPAVLVRLPSGWWGRHTGTDLPRLIDALDPDIVCEQELKTRLVDRLYEAKRSLNLGTLAMKSIHAEWFWNQRKVEKWLAAKEIALEDMEQSTVERMKMVELAYARSSENRINTLSAIITRNECPDVNEPPPITGSRLERDILRKKRIKDLSFEDMLELHPVKGWVRSDMMAHLKGLYASTIASRLLADPTSFNLFNLYMKKCAFRTSDIAVPAPPPFSEEDIGISQDDFEALEELEEELSAPRPNTFYSSSTHARVKPVEQLDLVTGAVVRRYPSGKDAAAIMKVSQGNISLVCNGTKSDSYNFKWRLYDGPPIDFDADNLLPGRKSIEELLAIRYSKTPMNKIPSNAKGGANPSIGSSNVAANNGPVTAGMDSAQRALRSGARVQLQQSLVRPAGQYTQYTHPKGYLQQHFAASNVPVDYRLLRLKAEFINMLLLIPPYLVNYRDSLELIMTQRSPHQYLKNFAERLLEDESRSSTETFISSIQSAASPQELLDCIVFFSKSLHRSVLMNFNEDFLPRSANCTATAAVYLYALDRALRYEDIISLNLPSVGKYKPRVQYCPRCLLSSTCSKPWGHGGRCSPGFENQFSRFIEISHEAPELRTHLVAPVFTVPAPLQFNTVPVYHATSAAAVRDPARFGTQYKRPLDSNIPNQGAQDGSRKLPADLTNYASLADVEVENITPYVPRAHELSSIIWV